MSRERFPQADHEPMVSRNVAIIDEFNRQYASPTTIGITSLQLIDPETNGFTTIIAECDDANRSALDELYDRLGIDMNCPTLTTSERFRPQHIQVRSVFYKLPHGNEIREQATTTANQSRFTVDIGQVFVR